MRFVQFSSLCTTGIFPDGPDSVTITGDSEVKAGETLTLTCTISNSNPPVQVKWRSHGTALKQHQEQIYQSPDGGFKTISQINVTVPLQLNNTVFMCEAYNPAVFVVMTQATTVSVLRKY